MIRDVPDNSGDVQRSTGFRISNKVALVPKALSLPLCPHTAGRSLSLLDPTYASKYIPIIASVSEHQPPAWTSYFTDLNALVRFLPSDADPSPYRTSHKMLEPWT